MPSAWLQALKEWNGDENKGMWCIPRKGSAQLDVVRGIVERIKNPKPEPVKRKLRIPKEEEPTMEPVKRKLRIPTPPEKESVPKAMEYFKYKENKSVDSYAIYKRTSIEPPVFESIFGATKKKVVQDGMPLYEITLKRNTKGAILRDLEHIPKTDEYFAKAIRGELKGQIVSTLSPYKPVPFEMDFINGTRDTAKYTEPYSIEEHEKELKSAETKKAKAARKDIAILTKRAIEEDDEIKKLNNKIEKLKEKRDDVYDKYKSRIDKAAKEKNRKLHDEIIEEMRKEFDYLKELTAVEIQIKKREAVVRKKVMEEAQ